MVVCFAVPTTDSCGWWGRFRYWSHELSFLNNVELTLLSLFHVGHNPTSFQVSNKSLVVVNIKTNDLSLGCLEIMSILLQADHFTEGDISTFSIRDGGARDILMEKVDLNTIQLVGQWRSNTIILYLHTMANSFTAGLVVHMLQHGDYALIPPTHAHI